MSQKFAPLFLSVAGLAFVTACSADAEPPATSSFVDEEVKSSGLVEVKDFTGLVIVKTGPGLKFDAKLTDGELVKSGKIDKPTIDLKSNYISVSGDEDLKIKQCKSNNGKYQLKLKGDKLRSLDSFPSLEITMPENANIDLNLDYGLAKIGNVQSSAVTINGCGDAFFQNVSGHFMTSINGSGDVEAKNVGNFSAEIKGSGDVLVGDVAGKAVSDVKGSGDIEMGHVDGEFYASIKGSGDIVSKSAKSKAIVEIKGSGDVEIGGGSFSLADVNIAGSGDVLIDAAVTDLNVNIRGSGDVEVDSLTGDITGSLRGSGDLVIDGEHLIYKNGQWYRPQ